MNPISAVNLVESAQPAHHRSARAGHEKGVIVHSPPCPPLAQYFVVWSGTKHAPVIEFSSI